jgi:TonB family protein
MKILSLLLLASLAALAQPPALRCPQADYQHARVKTKVNPKGGHMEGTVKIRLRVNAQGMPEDVTLWDGIDDKLNEKAVEAVRKWRFFPATCKGQPVPESAVAEIEIKFTRK